jgi:hypothetical protein
MIYRAARPPTIVGPNEGNVLLLWIGTILGGTHQAVQLSAARNLIRLSDKEVAYFVEISAQAQWISAPLIWGTMARMANLGAGTSMVDTPTRRRPGLLSANARHEEIYHLAVTTGLASVEELSARFEVTASTIRRDLALLSGQGRPARRPLDILGREVLSGVRGRANITIEGDAAIHHAAPRPCS